MINSIHKHPNLPQEETMRIYDSKTESLFAFVIFYFSFLSPFTRDILQRAYVNDSS